MTTTSEIRSNPFALLMEPEAVLEAVARSERLARLHSRILRPLDKPVMTARDANAANDDAAIDASGAEAESPEILDPFHPLAPL